MEAFDAGPAALARLERTGRLTERIISWSIREDQDVPAPSPLVVKGIVADGARIVRARLLDGRAEEIALLAGELTDLCCVAAAAVPPGYGHRLAQPAAH